MSEHPREPELDIVIPVYNEGENILHVLNSLKENVKTTFQVLLCYDHKQDNTLPIVRSYPSNGSKIRLIKNRGRGVLGAVKTGFEDSTAPAVLMYPADDDYNATQIDKMMQRFREGCDIVAASRFIPGGCMKGCPWLKATLVRCSAFVLYHLARLPTHDPSNGLRIFSRRLLDTVPIESTVGFAYSIELLVKAHRLGWQIGEVPAGWFERRQGKSRFKVLNWVPQYLKWFFYAFATTYFCKGARSVRLKEVLNQPSHQRS